MTRYLLACLLVAGCGRVGFSGIESTDAANGDAARDADAPDGSDAPSALVPQFIQTSGMSNSSTMSVVGTFTSDVTAGNFILLEVDAHPSTTAFLTTGITDTLGDSYTFLASEANPTQNNISFLAYTFAKSSGPNTVTVTSTTLASQLEVYMLEYANISATNTYDTEVGGSQNGASTPGGASAGPFTTDSPNELLVFVLLCSGACGAGDATFTTRNTMSGNLVQDLNATTLGDYTAHATSPSAWRSTMDGFRAVQP